jgi:hypothetical protein
VEIAKVKRDKTDICQFCEHTWEHHHRGCNKCYAIPSTHGHYCEGALCSCIDFVPEDALSDEDIQVLTGVVA